MKKKQKKTGKRRDKAEVPKAVSSRLSFYLRELEILKMLGTETISSQHLAALLDISSSQVRKDLGHFGQFGFPGLGYGVERLITSIKKIIGRDKVWQVCLVGCGNVGSALIHYKGFAASGFHIAAVFDNSHKKTGKKAGRLSILPMSEFEPVVKKKRITIGVISVPASAAQDVADGMAMAGIKGILNFARVTLKVPAGVKVVGVDLAVQMEQLIFHLSN